jgi:hypothetical protein
MIKDMNIKTYYKPINDWKNLDVKLSGINNELGYEEYMFVSEHPRVGILTYYKGGELDGQLTIEPEDYHKLKDIPNWKEDLKKHFTEQTGLPVNRVDVW